MYMQLYIYIYIHMCIYIYMYYACRRWAMQQEAVAIILC